MLPTLRVLLTMGSLQRLFPLWMTGIVMFFVSYNHWLLLAVIYGVIMQFLVEYVMHRFLLHREPPHEQSTFNELYRSHIGHHEFPNDPEFFTGGDNWYAFRFGVISVMLHTVVLWPFVGFYSALQWSSVALFVGSISAFAFYEFCHTLAHLKVPKGWFGEAVTRSHMKHHFLDHHATFHVSFGMNWIDRLFGTPYNKDTAKERFDRETILSMGMDPEDLRLVTARKSFGLPKMPGTANDHRKAAS